MATTAAVVTVITMLIVGRVERVQFRGPGVQVPARSGRLSGSHFVRHNLVLDDGPSTTAEYYLPYIPPDTWRTFYRNPSDHTRHMVKARCFSVVMLDAAK